MTLAEALRAAALYVEQHRTMLVRSGLDMMTDEDRPPLIAEVSALGHDLDELAAASETARVYQREYEALEGDLQRRGFFLTPEIAQAVADAFHAERMANATFGSPR